MGRPKGSKNGNGKNRNLPAVVVDDAARRRKVARVLQEDDALGRAGERTGFTSLFDMIAASLANARPVYLVVERGDLETLIVSVMRTAVKNGFPINARGAAQALVSHFVGTGIVHEVEVAEMSVTGR